MSKNADIAYLLAQANSGSASAQYNLGVIYLSGEQVEQNYEKALAYFTLAANHGNTKAEYNLGVMYANGYGVKQNYDRA
jgi:TPR repeat protein